MTEEKLGRFVLVVGVAVLGAIAGCLLGFGGVWLLTDCNFVEGECTAGLLIGTLAGAILVPSIWLWLASRGTR